MSGATASKANKASNTTDEQIFRRVFRFHPRAWREQNEAVASGVLMDAAEATGSTRVRLADRLSIYGHAASTWLDRGISRADRETLASLALGTGIAMGLVHFLLFWVMNYYRNAAFQEETGFAPPFALSISALVVNGLWIASALFLLFQKQHIVRWIAVVAIIACVSTVVMRLGLKGYSFDGAITPLFFGLWATLTAFGRARAALVWGAAGAVAVVVVAFILYQRLVTGIGYGVDVYLWTDMAFYLRPALFFAFVASAIAGALGHRTFALVSLVYVSPWVVLLLSVSSVGNYMPLADAAVMAGIWLTASSVVFGIAHFRGRNPVRQKSR